MSNIGYPTVNNWAGDATAIGAIEPGELVSAAVRLKNTKTMQAILDLGGDLRITAPGVYLFDVSSGPLALPSNTSLYVGAGVTLKVAPGSPSALFTNSAARSTGVTVPIGSASFATAPDGANYCAVITNMTAANAARFPVNSWVSVVALGHGALGVKGTAWNMRGYRGVRRVVEQTINGNSSSIKYLIDNVYPGSAPSDTAMTMFPANENIKVWGPGTIDGNGALADQTYVTGNPAGCTMWWRHAYTVTVDGLKFLRGVTWSIGSNYVRNYIVRSVSYELRNTPTFTTTDLVHLSGNHQNVLISDVDGGTGDNAVGMTIDCTGGTAYDFAYQSPGDMYDVTLRRIAGEAICEDGSFGIIAMYGPEAYLYHNVVIDGVTGIGSSALQFANYAATNQNKLTIDRLSISNVRAMTGSAQVEFTAGAVFDIGDLILDGILTPRDDVPAFRAYDTATGNIRVAIMRNLTFTPYDGATFTRTAAMARFGGLNIGALNISGTEGLVQAVNIRAFAADGPGNIPKVGIQGCSGTSSGTGAGLAALWADTGAGTAAAPVYNNCTSNGTAL